MDKEKINPEIDPDKAFDEVFEQALSILKEAIEYADKPVNPDAPMGLISEHLVMLESHVRDFIKGNQEVIEAAKKKNLEEGKENQATLSKESQRLIKKSEDLIRKANAKREEIAERVRQGHDAAAAEAEKGGGETKPKSSKDQPRKNKFRRIGGNKNWKPL